MDNSQGLQASVEFSKSFRIGQRFSIEPGVTVTWFDEKYVDYYYGVTALEATSNRPEFLGEAAVAYDAGVSFRYGLDAHQSLSLSARVRTFDQKIEDSPLVGQNNETRFAFTYVYRF